MDLKEEKTHKTPRVRCSTVRVFRRTRPKTLDENNEQTNGYSRITIHQRELN